MLNKLRVGCVQINAESGSQGEVIERSLVLGRNAMDENADLILLPEQWLGIRHWPKAVERWKTFASEYEVDVVPGASFLEWGDSLRIAGVVIGSQGEVLGRQTKIYPYGEEIGEVEPGSTLKIFETPRGYGLGLVICHGIVYPETARSLALNGADVLVNPAKIKTEGIDPWHLYLKVRALENRIPIVGANCAIPDKYPGGSLAVDIKVEGEDIVHPVEKVKGGKGEDSVVGELDLEAARELRRGRLKRVREDFEVQYLDFTS